MKGGLNIPSYVRDALASVARKLGFTDGQHSVDYDLRPGENNRSVVSFFYRVTFCEEPRETTVLCKVPPAGADEILLTLFEREVFVYGKLLPAFEQFQRHRHIEMARDAPTSGARNDAAEEETIAFGPHCYHAHCDVKKGEGILILEDVRRRGFSNRYKFQPLDYDHARMAMVQLGRFHAISLALKQQQPELFEQYRHMGDVTRERVLEMEGFEQSMEQAFESAIATLNPGDLGRREKLMRLRGSFAEELQNISDAALSEPFCVVCHGDYAGDNMMFSYNIQSIDEDLSRVIVKFALGGNQESLNEYMVQLVSKEEYNKFSRILNAAKYEEFKKREIGVKPEKHASERLNDGVKLRSGESSSTERTTKDERREHPDRSVSRERDRHDQQSDRAKADQRDTAKSADRTRDQQKRESQENDRCRDRPDRGRSPKKGGVGNSRRSPTADPTFSDSERRKTDSDESREHERRKHKKSSSSYVRTSSGTKKKSHKYKQRRERRDERGTSYDRHDRRQHGSESESDDKRHKKKTKKSKKPRSRSRSRR